MVHVEDTDRLKGAANWTPEERRALAKQLFNDAQSTNTFKATNCFRRRELNGKALAGLVELLNNNDTLELILAACDMSDARDW